MKSTAKARLAAEGVVHGDSSVIETAERAAFSVIGEHVVVGECLPIGDAAIFERVMVQEGAPIDRVAIHHRVVIDESFAGRCSTLVSVCDTG